MLGSVAGVYSGSPPESGRPTAISFAAGAAGPNYLFGFGPKRGKYAGRQFHDDFKGNIGAKPLAGASVKNKKKKRDIPFLLFVSCSVGVFGIGRPGWRYGFSGASAAGKPRAQNRSHSPSQINWKKRFFPVADPPAASRGIRVLAESFAAPVASRLYRMIWLKRGSGFLLFLNAAAMEKISSAAALGPAAFVAAYHKKQCLIRWGKRLNYFNR